LTTYPEIREAVQQAFSGHPEEISVPTMLDFAQSCPDTEARIIAFALADLAIDGTDWTYIETPPEPEWPAGSHFPSLTELITEAIENCW